MNCRYCNGRCHKKGTQRNGALKLRCVDCKKYQLSGYSRKAYLPETDKQLVVLLKEGCGTRSISRILGIATRTITKRILLIASRIEKPMVLMGKTHEVDELITYVGCKENRICIVYAIDRQTREPIDFRVGRRNKTTLKGVITTLLLAESKEIRTDRLNLYLGLIPKSIHSVKQRGINYIERKNLTLRTQLKRLNRKTICFSKSIAVLAGVLKIYFWG